MMSASEKQAALLAAVAAHLDGRARDRSIRTEDAAVSRFRPQARSTSLAVVEKPAGVSRHRLGGLMTADRTGQRRLKLHESFTSKLYSALEGKQDLGQPECS